MDFLWHLRGAVKLTSTVSDETALDGLEQLLKRQRKSPERRLRSIFFEAPLGGDPLGGWRAMVIYDRGLFWIDDGPHERMLRYDLRSLHAMMFCLIGALMFFFLGCVGGGLWMGLTLGAAAFAWVYGMNVLLALARVPGAIRAAIRTS